MPKGRHPRIRNSKQGLISIGNAKTDFSSLQKRASAAIDAREKAFAALTRCMVSVTILTFLAGLSLDVVTVDSQTGSIKTWKLVAFLLLLVGAIVLLWRTVGHVENYATRSSEADSLQTDIDRHLGY